jgi:DNA polymerase III subunit delta'
MPEDYGLEPDRRDDTPHPRETEHLFGHQAAERDLLTAYRSGRMHHAWIIGGEEGIGKATLAYRFARFVLAHPDSHAAELRHATNLHVPPDNGAARRVAHLSHPDLFVLRRGLTADRKSAAAEIKVDDARRLVSFFSTTAGEGGWRVAIVDTADDLNINSANALLKVLEEPPPRSLFLILTATPKRLLPTIRSRARTLLLQPLQTAEVEGVLKGLPDLAADPDDIRTAAEASDGSVSRALALLSEDRIALRQAVAAILDDLPRVDHARVHALAERMMGRDGAAGFELLVAHVLDWLHARMLKGAAEGEARLARWPELWDKTARAAREADIYNLDRRPLVLGIVSDLAAASRG